MGYSPWSRKELDTTERLTLSNISLVSRRLFSVKVGIRLSNRSNSNRSQRERRHPGGVRIWGRCLAEWRDRVATLSLAGWVHPAQSHLTLCNPTDCSLPGSSAHGILQAKILE